MKSQTILYTMRHARTAYNQEKRYAGSLDISLCEQGLQDIERMKTMLDFTAFDLVITSEMKRCIETARCLVGDGTPVMHTALCNERRFGVMEGKTWEEVQQLDPPILFIEVGGDLHSVNPRDGEPLEEVWCRSRRFLDETLLHHAGKRILVISHGVFLQMLHGVMNGISCIEALAYYPGNLEVNRFALSGRQVVDRQVLRYVEEKPARW